MAVRAPGVGSVGKQRGHFLKAPAHFTKEALRFELGSCGLGGPRSELYLERGVVVAVDDFSEGDFAPEQLGENQGVKRQQQSVILGELVPEDEANRNELRGLAPSFRRHALDGVEA